MIIAPAERHAHTGIDKLIGKVEFDSDPVARPFVRYTLDSVSLCGGPVDKTDEHQRSAVPLSSRLFLGPFQNALRGGIRRHGDIGDDVTGVDRYMSRVIFK